MSESADFKKAADTFERRHPAKEGWRMFLLTPSGRSVLTAKIPAFLRAKAPKSVLREEISTAITLNPDKRGYRLRLRETPCVRKGIGLREDDWCGEIDFTWKGAQIHYERRVFCGRNSDAYYGFVATKDWGALEDFWRGLHGYYEQISKRPGRMRDIFEGIVERPKSAWNDLILPPGMAEDIRANTESFLKAKKSYRELGLAYRRGFLFSGPPGTGKTLAVKTIAAQCRCSVIVVPLRKELDDGVINAAFRLAGEDGPTILILEDLDRLATHEKISLSHLLNLLDGINSPEGMLLVATTNAPEKLDQALLQRPSRFDKVWHFGLPGTDERLRLLQKKSLGKFSEEAVREAARRSRGCTGAMVQECVINAFLAALHENRPVRDEDLLASVDATRRQFESNSKIDGHIRSAAAVGFVNAA